MAAKSDVFVTMRNLTSAIAESRNRSLSSSEDESDFCNGDNIEDAIATLFEELEALGLAEENSSKSCQSHERTLIDLTNAAWRLVHKHRSLMKCHEDLKDSRHKISNDNANLTNSVKRLKENLEKKQHALSEALERERRLKVRTECLSRDLKREKEETIKLKKQAQSKDVQHTHELRRIQQSGHKLREQLEKSSSNVASKDKVAQKSQIQVEKRLRLYEKMNRRLEDNNRLMHEEINELRDALALHAAGIDLQVEASGLWDNVET